MESSQPLMNVQAYASPDEFMGQIKSLQYISQGLEDLRTSPTAIVYYGTPCCSVKCCLPCSCIFNCKLDCGDNFAYNTLVVNNGETKYLYRNIGRLDCKICATDAISRFAYVKSLNLNSYDQINSGLGTESVQMTKENNCVVCGLCSNFLCVSVKPENRPVGYVRYKGTLDDCCGGSCCCVNLCCCCCLMCKNFCTTCQPCDICFDYYYCCDILSLARQVVYTIYLRRCCISCCPLDCLNSITFVIKNAYGVEVGRIELRRTCCTFCGLRGNNCTYTINFPLDATRELKLTIINAVISIDMFLM